MRNTTVATIDAHRASFYCVLLFLCGGSIVWQNTGHLRVVVFGRELSYVRELQINAAITYSPKKTLSDFQGPSRPEL